MENRGNQTVGVEDRLSVNVIFSFFFLFSFDTLKTQNVLIGLDSAAHWMAESEARELLEI